MRSQLVWLCLACVLAVATADADDIHRALETTCHELCTSRVNNAEMCKAFCGFTNGTHLALRSIPHGAQNRLSDIFQEHLKELDEIWQRGGQKVVVRGFDC